MARLLLPDRWARHARGRCAREDDPVSNEPLLIAGIILLVVPSITSHEAAHGFVADWLGDPTARQRGRLTLNPLPHIDLFFTILLPAFLILSGAGFIFGGAKPVPVDVSRLRHPRRDWALVGAAGPLTNLAIALGLAAVLAVLLRSGVTSSASVASEVLSVGIFVNVLLAVFNLIPIPPLDGSRVAQFLLPPRLFVAYARLERIGLLLIVALIFFVRPAQVILAWAIFVAVALVTAPFGIARDVEGVLRGLLFG